MTKSGADVGPNAVERTAEELRQDAITEWATNLLPFWEHPDFAEMIERPDVFEREADDDDDMIRAGFKPNGPWIAVLLEDGNVVNGELVAPISDTLTMRMYVQIGEDKGKDYIWGNDSISIFDVAYPVARLQSWFTTEGQDWELPATDESDPLGDMGVYDTGFPRRS